MVFQFHDCFAGHETIEYALSESCSELATWLSLPVNGYYINLQEVSNIQAVFYDKSSKEKVRESDRVTVGRKTEGMGKGGQWDTGTIGTTGL